ncbi:MAG: 23S rRNA (adenine(2503)-C(2))-methyltransferase RlmN [Spirochaetota bacterium]
MWEYKEKQNLLEMSYAETESFLIKNGISLTVLDSLYKDIHKHNVYSISELSLNKYRKNLLQNIADIEYLELIEKKSSILNNSFKYLFKLKDGYYIETVLLILDNKITLCLSSQSGCSLGCTFCATGSMGLNRNLSTGEILSQVYYIARDSGYRINNIVYMGMGEPFLNYDNIIKSAHILNNNLGMNIGAQRISISTVGIAPMIERYIEESQPFHIILSLHSAIQEKREILMPVARKYKINRLIELIELYYKKRRDWATIAYIMIKDFNMYNEDIINLKKLLSPLKCKLNLIPYNKVNGIAYKSPTKKEIDKFHKSFYDLNLPVNVRKTIGQDIEGACGQLTINKEVVGVMKNGKNL